MEVAERSLTNGRLFGLQLPGVPLDDDPLMLPDLGEAIENNWKWSMYLKSRLNCDSRPY
jgi:salicylate hydroxylase